MSNIQIKRVPEPVHEELRRRAAEAGVTVRDYVLNLIARDQEVPSRAQWARRLAGLPRVDLERPPGELVEEGRRSRPGGESR